MGLVINKNTTITDHVSINLGTDKDTFIGELHIMNHSYIAHDVEVGDRSIIAPGTKVLGRAVLGKKFIWEQIKLLFARNSRGTYTFSCRLFL